MGKLADALIALDKSKVLDAVNAGIDAGQDPLEIVDQARQGMDEIGRKFESGEFFLMELMRAAQIFESAAEILNPVIKERYGDVESKGTVLLGAVKGDIHDLGKNIVGNLLECRGFDVINLGVDVPGDVSASSRDERLSISRNRCSPILESVPSERSKRSQQVARQGYGDSFVFKERDVFRRSLSTDRRVCNPR